MTGRRFLTPLAAAAIVPGAVAVAISSGEKAATAVQEGHAKLQEGDGATGASHRGAALQRALHQSSAELRMELESASGSKARASTTMVRATSALMSQAFQGLSGTAKQTSLAQLSSSAEAEAPTTRVGTLNKITTLLHKMKSHEETRYQNDQYQFQKYLCNCKKNVNKMYAAYKKARAALESIRNTRLPSALAQQTEYKIRLADMTKQLDEQKTEASKTSDDMSMEAQLAEKEYKELLKTETQIVKAYNVINQYVKAGPDMTVGAGLSINLMQSRQSAEPQESETGSSDLTPTIADLLRLPDAAWNGLSMSSSDADLPQKSLGPTFGKSKASSAVLLEEGVLASHKSSFAAAASRHSGLHPAKISELPLDALANPRNYVVSVLRSVSLAATGDADDEDEGSHGSKNRSFLQAQAGSQTGMRKADKEQLTMVLGILKGIGATTQAARQEAQSRLAKLTKSAAAQISTTAGTIASYSELVLRHRMAYDKYSKEVSELKLQEKDEARIVEEMTALSSAWQNTCKSAQKEYTETQISISQSLPKFEEAIQIFDEAIESGKLAGSSVMSGEAALFVQLGSQSRMSAPVKPHVDSSFRALLQQTMSFAQQSTAASKRATAANKAQAQAAGRKKAAVYTRIAQIITAQEANLKKELRRKDGVLNACKAAVADLTPQLKSRINFFAQTQKQFAEFSSNLESSKSGVESKAAEIKQLTEDFVELTAQHTDDMERHTEETSERDLLSRLLTQGIKKLGEMQAFEKEFKETGGINQSATSTTLLDVGDVFGGAAADEDSAAVSFLQVAAAEGGSSESSSAVEDRPAEFSLSWAGATNNSILAADTKSKIFALPKKWQSKATNLDVKAAAPVYLLQNLRSSIEREQRAADANAKDAQRAYESEKRTYEEELEDVTKEKAMHMSNQMTLTHKVGASSAKFDNTRTAVGQKLSDIQQEVLNCMQTGVMTCTGVPLQHNAFSLATGDKAEAFDTTLHCNYGKFQDQVDGVDEAVKDLKRVKQYLYKQLCAVESESGAVHYVKACGKEP